MDDKIRADLKLSMLARDSKRVQVLRDLLAAVKKVSIDDRKEIDDDIITNTLVKEVKKRNESIVLYEKAKRPELAATEKEEIAILQKYLPEALSEDELVVIIDSVIAEQSATSMAQMGQVIGAVKQRAGASADGAVIARMVKEKLQ